MVRRERFRTQFCFIAPASLLDRYASASRTHLVLPQVENPRYVDYYQRKRREGDYIILDNGAYEGVDNWSLLLSGIERDRPNVAALPDFLLSDGERSFLAARDFLIANRGRYPDVKWMYIPQSRPGDLQGWYKWLNIGIKELKPDWIGIPRALATDIAQGPNAWLARADAVEQLTMRGIKTHALGMVKGNLKELEALFWEGCCSVDNSSPVWRGLNGYHLDHPDAESIWDHNGTPVDFNWEGHIGPWLDSVIKHNMNLVLRTLGQKGVI
jgi:hypothetical protein